MDKIVIKGARENNLQNIDIDLPKNSLIVMTGVSGSGKSSLAFDTIYAEGQRRYVESLSTYARQFLGGTEKPDVDSIEGLSPAISIDQKTTSNNPRSTVGTATEIYDYLRLLFARIGVVYCPEHGNEITSQSIEEMTNKLMSFETGTRVIIMAPIVDGEKGEHKELFKKLKAEGFVRLRVDGEDKDLSEEIKLDKNIKHKIEVIIDRLVIKENIRSRVFESLETAAQMTRGKVLINKLGDKEYLMSETFACPQCSFSLPELEPNMFSFNSPFGACPECNGLGIKRRISAELLVPNEDLSINQNAIKTLGDDKENIYNQMLACVCKQFKIDMNKAFKNLSKKAKDIIFYGTEEDVHFKYVSKAGNLYDKKEKYEGIVNNLERRYLSTSSTWIRDWIEGYMIELTCEACNGARLSENILAVKINKKNIFELTSMSVAELKNFLIKLKLNAEKKEISKLLLNEISNRLDFLINVGLDYLTLARMAGTLSGGEAQRIRLATQIGSRLTGVLYVLDEPSIGLHQKDNQKLIKSLKEMRDLGNTLIVVEHDNDTMLASDYLVDIGPLAGDSGGKIVAAGSPKEVMKNEKSLTGQFLSGKEMIEVPKKRRKGKGSKLSIRGAAENNLKNINVDIPLGTLTCVTGVSGSGKSSLIIDILSKRAQIKVYNSRVKAGKVRDIKGLEHIDKIVEIDQSPIGRTPRSNPATYTGVFDEIRNIFSNTKEAKVYGFGKSRFSFNLKGGRCEACRGEGVKRIEMHFLPDVYVPCEVCQGTRYNSETLRVKYKNKNIAEVLNMRVSEAYEFFENIPKIEKILKILKEIGLGYIQLGQSAPTLSGGEASRVKLVKELQKVATGKTLYIMDEPTTGLHAYDIKSLLAIIKKIVDNKDTVVIIEHNLDMIKTADYIIDLGPDGGDQGGELVASGTPEELAKHKTSYTGEFLKKVL